MSRDRLGEFEQLVVMALLRLGEKAYAVSVRDEIELRANRKVSLGAVYATLDRLEEKGFAISHRGDPTPERGGRAKRFYRLNAAGQLALRRSLAETRDMLHGIPALGALP